MIKRIYELLKYLKQLLLTYRYVFFCISTNLILFTYRQYRYTRSVPSYLNSIASTAFFRMHNKHCLSLYLPNDFQQKIISYTVCRPFFTPHGRPLRAAARESLKNPRLRVKRKTGREREKGGNGGPGYLSRRGNHVSHVDPRL